jgi:hypothetical protein
MPESQLDIVLKLIKQGRGAEEIDAALKDVNANAKSAKAQIADLEKTIAGLQGKAKGGVGLTTADLQVYGQASAQLKQLKSALAELDPPTVKAKTGLRGMMDTVSQASPGLSSLTSKVAGLAGPVGLGLLAGSAIKGAWTLGELGAAFKRTEQYFTTYSGSVAQAAENLDALIKATDGALSKQSAMEAGSKYLSMGLAKNSEELAKLSRMAVLLGGSQRSATEAMEEFALLLANQSILRLDTFGISGARVRERIEELMKAEQGLTREQAFMNAVMEVGGEKVKALEAAGVQAGTASDRLAAASHNAAVALGTAFAPAVDTVKSSLADLLNVMTREWNPGVDELKRKIAELENAVSAGGFDEHTQLMRAELERLREQLEKLQPPIMEANTLLGVAAVRAFDAARGAASEYTEKIKGVIYNLDILRAKDIAWGLELDREHGGKAPMTSAKTGATVYMPATPEAPKYADWQLNPGAFWDSWQQNWTIKSADEVNAELERAAEKAAKATEKAFETAFDNIKGFAEGALSGAQNSLSGLMGGNTDPNAPGKNGPFENLFRAADVATHGGDSPWAAKLGLTKEQATKIVNDFRQGLITEEVKALIDMPALVQQTQMAAMAEKLTAQFTEEIAKAAQADTSTVEALMGITKGKDGKIEAHSIVGAVGAMLDATGQALVDKRDKVMAIGEQFGTVMVSGIDATKVAAIASVDGIFTAVLTAIRDRANGLLNGPTGGGGAPSPAPPGGSPGGGGGGASNSLRAKGLR